MNTKERVLLFLALSVFAIALIGVPAGWYFRGFSAAELKQLEEDWAQVVSWADLPAAEPVLDKRATAREQQAAYGSTLELMQLGELELASEDLDAKRMDDFLSWTRSLQREGTMIEFMIGTRLGMQALERCRLEPALIPAKLSAPAPTIDEFFYGLCRDFVLAERSIRNNEAMRNAYPEEIPEEFVFRAMRRAKANAALRFYPLRNDPAGFGPQPPVEMPGTSTRWSRNSATDGASLIQRAATAGFKD